MNINLQATEVFVHGFAFTRSANHPYVPEQVTPTMWVMRDAPRTRDDYRVEEYVAVGMNVHEIVQLAQRHTHGRYRICVIIGEAETDTAIRTEFHQLGYRLLATEAHMIHQFAPIVPIVNAATAYAIVRVTTMPEAEALAKAAGQKQILPKYLTANPTPMRQYMALDKNTPIGWVGSVVVGDYTWCTNMFVQPEYRRQGIGRALLGRMLADDHESGSTANILLASHAGAKLYTSVGYQQIGQLLMFAPRK